MPYTLRKGIFRKKTSPSSAEPYKEFNPIISNLITTLNVSFINHPWPWLTCPPPPPEVLLPAGEAGPEPCKPYPPIGGVET